MLGYVLYAKQLNLEPRWDRPRHPETPPERDPLIRKRAAPTGERTGSHGGPADAQRIAIRASAP